MAPVGSQEVTDPPPQKKRLFDFVRKLSFLDFLWDVATGNSLDGFQWHHPDHSTFSKNNAIFLGPFCRHLPRHVYYCISGANMKSTPRFVGCVCETESRRDREREKKCSEMIVPLSVVQECGLKGTKHCCRWQPCPHRECHIREGNAWQPLQWRVSQALGNKIVTL